MLQGRKVHPQRHLSVSTIKRLNLLRALSSYTHFAAVATIAYRNTSVVHALACKSPSPPCKRSEKSCWPLGRLCWDLLGLTKTFTVPHSPFLPDFSFPTPSFHLSLWSRDCNALRIISSLSQNRPAGVGTINNRSFLTYSRRLGSALTKTNPSVPLTDRCHQRSPHTSPSQQGTHLYTHLFLLTSLICPNTGPNTALNAPRPCIL